MRISTLRLLVSLALQRGVLARVAPRAGGEITTTSTAVTATVDACAVVSSLSSSFVAANPEVTPVTVPRSNALDCLYSIPVDVQRDIKLLDYILPYVQLQSTLGFLKNPPDEYLLPGVDVLGGIATIREMLLNDTYQYQYDFVTDINRIFVLANDGHFSYTPALLNNVFGFNTEIPFVSLSKNGQELPKIYLATDIAKLEHENAISDITSINSISAVDFFEQAAAFLPFQDPDALYQSMFYSTGGYPAGSGNQFYNFPYPGLPETLELQFSNGTTRPLEIQAKLQLDFTNIDSGKDVRYAVEIPSTTTTTTAASTSTETATSTPSTTFIPAIPGYPWPVEIHYEKYISGYFLNETGYEDTAVLSVSAFSNENMDPELDNLEFRHVLIKFLAKCKTEGKTKLIVDLQGNGGGYVGLGLELFKRLFPQIDLFMASTTLATPFLGSMLHTNYTVAKDAIGSPVDANGVPFASWDALFGPQVLAYENLTSSFQYNYSDYKSNDMAFAPAGYGTNKTIPPSPFTAENIVIITDGQCSSTCTTFVGMATRLAGVRTIAYGGRPQNLPMQAIGGVKGSQVLQWAVLQSLASEVRDANNGSIPADYPGPPSSFPSAGDPPLNPNLADSRAQVNWKNAHRSFDDTTPLQFVYEAANCRQFFTLATWRSMVALWESAADIAWHGAKCVRGSTANADNTIGDSTLPYTAAVRASSNFRLSGPGAI